MRKYTPLLPVATAFAASALTWSDIPANATADFSALVPMDATSTETLPRVVAALLIPTVSLIVYLFLARLSSVKGPVRNIPQWWLNEQTGEAAVKRFEPTYNTILFGVTALLALIHLVNLGAILSWPGWFFQGFTALLGAGLIAVGNVFPRVRPNWIVGIRTKRTLSNPQLWASAHRTLGALLVGAGLLTIIASIVAPRWALIVAIASLLVSLVISGIASQTRALAMPRSERSTPRP